MFNFFGELPFTLSPKSYRNGLLGVSTRYVDEIRIILKLRTSTLSWTTLETSIKDLSFFGERPFTLSPKVSPKWITRSKNTLQRWQKDYSEAKNMYFHLAYLGIRY